MAAFEPRPCDPIAAAELSRSLGIHPVTAQVLACRGIVEEAEARRFLAPGPAQLHDPGLFKDIDAATAMAEATIRDGGRIVVYGDYDVDGVCATTVLLKTLRALGADAEPFIPHRVDDGYGLSGAVLDRFGADGTALVITVDNGTTRGAEIAEAQAAGLKVIVTDHHEAGATLPPCPLINPKRPDTTYPFAGLAGCGVSFKLAIALAQRMNRLASPDFKALMPDLLAAVAIGTIADVMPLRDENRSLVSMGLKALEATRHPGLRALLAVSRCDGRRVRTTDVGFRIGPRLNAAGRIGSALLSLELLLCEDEEEAKQMAKRLDEGNRERQRIERKQAEEAFAQAERRLAENDSAALVLSESGWHPGVIGIVAARAAETFHKPVALISVDGDTARGSARSFGTALLHEALEDCSDLLLTHGGHAKAAGFTMKASEIDAFRIAFAQAVENQGGERAGPRRVDAELPIDAISAPLAAEIDSLQPFGQGNEEPVFCAFGVRAAGRPRRTGPGERNLTFYAATDRSSVRAIAFQESVREEQIEKPFNLAFVLRRAAGPEPYEIHVRGVSEA